jgi:dephospho-CoA kinase
MKKHLVIGLTGGIGSGKTLASDHFAKLAIDIIDTDVIARNIVEPGQTTLASLVNEFGNKIINSDGHLNRSALRTIAFSNKSNKAKLDSITHPAIREETNNQIQASNSQYCIVVVPLLTKDSPFSKVMQRIIAVTANHETKIQRVKVRSNLSSEEVEKIMNTQLSDEQRLEFADDIIENNSTKQYVYDEVEKLHLKYLELSKLA